MCTRFNLLCWIVANLLNIIDILVYVLFYTQCVRVNTSKVFSDIGKNLDAFL